MPRIRPQACSSRHIALAMLVVAGLVLVSRSFFGAGFWADEAYSLSTTMRYHLGDRPLVDSWDSNFSSAILALPFLKTYLAIARSSDGIMLAFRSVWVALALLTVTCTYRVLKDLLPAWSAATVSALPALLPFSGYGGDWLWHMLAAVAAVRLLGRPPSRAGWHAVPGVLSALGVIANPPTVTVVPFFAFALWLAHRKVGGRSAEPVALYLVGGFATGLAFAVVLRYLSGPAMLSMLGQVMNPDDHDFGLAAQAARLLRARSMLAGPVIAGIVLGLALLKLGLDKKAAITSLAVILGVLGALAGLATGRVYLLIAPPAMVFMTAATLLSVGVTSLRDALRPEQTLLALPAAGAAIGWFLGSNTGWGAALLASPLLLAAALFWWFGEIEPLGTLNPRCLRGAARGMLLALLIAVPTVSLLTYPEGSITAMTSRILVGPFKGIYTTPELAARHEATVRALESLPRTPGRTTFLERFPLGYLVGGVRPGTYSTWATSADSQRFQTYVDLTGNAPSRIVLTRFGFDLIDGRFPSTVNLRDFHDEYVQVFENGYFRVFDSVAATPE